MAMTTRFCPRCENEVHDAGGYCLLGHKLALEPLDASLSELREEIDRAFEDARLEVAAVVTGTEITEPMPVVRRTAPPPPPPAPRVRRAVPPPPPPPRPAEALPVPAPAVPLAPGPTAPAPLAPPEAPPVSAAPVSPPAPVREAPSISPVPTPPPAPVRETPAVEPPQAPPPPAAQVITAPKPAPPEPLVSHVAPAAPQVDDFPREEEVLARKYPVWNELEEASPLIGDPIGAFAPKPHMDWGPDKTPKLLKRRPSRSARRASEEQ